MIRRQLVVCCWIFAVLSLCLLTLSGWAQESISSSESSSTEERSHWSSSYFGLASMTVAQSQKSSPSLMIYNYVGANYRLSNDERINLRPAFIINTAGTDSFGLRQDSEAKLADFYVNYANYKMGLLPGEWGLSGQFRIYLPTSESTQARKTIFYFNSWMVAEKNLKNNWALFYNFKPTYYVQSQKAYRNEYDRLNPDGSISTMIEPGANPIGKLDHYMTIAKWWNETWIPKIDIGFLHQWNHSSDYVRKGSASRNQLKIAPGTEIIATRTLRFIFSVENDVDLNDTRFVAEDGGQVWKDSRNQPIYLFRPESTQYLLFTFWSL